MGSLQSFETKNLVLADIINLYGIETLVETGSYLGDSIQYALDDLGMQVVYSCDLDKSKYDVCTTRFKGVSSVVLMHTTSFTFLEQTLPLLENQKSVLFWLDAHFADNMMMPDFREIDYPLETELEIIHRYRGDKDDVILIDDYCIYEAGPYQKRKDFKTAYAEKLVPTFLNKYSYKKTVFLSDNGYLLLNK